MVSILGAYASKLVVIYCLVIFNLLCSFSFDRSTQHLLIGIDINTIAKPAEFMIAKSILNCALYYKVDLTGTIICKLKENRSNC